MKLMNPVNVKRLIIYTDASYACWSGIVTHIPRAQVYLPHGEQEHEPLAFYSVRFNPTEAGWTTL